MYILYHVNHLEEHVAHKGSLQNGINSTLLFQTLSCMYKFTFLKN